MKAADAALEYLGTMKERDSGKASYDVVEFFFTKQIAFGFQCILFLCLH